MKQVRWGVHLRSANWRSSLRTCYLGLGEGYYKIRMQISTEDPAPVSIAILDSEEATKIRMQMATEDPRSILNEK